MCIRDSALAARLAILLAEWGLGVSHRQTAIELLRALGEPGADADPSLRAAWHLASGRAAHEGGEPARALVHFDAARRALQQAGRERTMTHVRTLIRLAHAQRGTQQVDAAAASLDEDVYKRQTMERPRQPRFGLRSMAPIHVRVLILTVFKRWAVGEP